MINQDEALAIAVEWAKRAEAEAAELRAALTDQWGAIISYSDTEPNIGADDM